MRTVRTKIYSFAELSKEAKERAIKAFRDTNYENIELDSFSDYCVDVASEKGFKDAKIRYSLSYSQGDGLSFDADMNIEQLIREAKPDIKTSVLDVLCNYSVHSCKANAGHYAYASESDIEFYLDGVDSYKPLNRLTEYVAEIESYIQDKYMNICSTLQADGYAEIEHQDSDEYIIETIEANEYEFTADGKQF